MHRRRAPRLVALIAVFLSAWTWAAAPRTASGSCAPPPSLEEAVRTSPVVLVATVMVTTNEGRWADVRVDEIWAGPDRGPIVTIRGGPGPGQATSVDRVFVQGVRYLLFPTIDQGHLGDNACSPTRAFDPAMARLRPPDARAPAAVTPSPPPAAPERPTAAAIPTKASAATAPAATGTDGTGADPTGTDPTAAGGGADASLLWVSGAVGVGLVLAAVVLAVRRRAA